MIFKLKDKTAKVLEEEGVYKSPTKAGPQEGEEEPDIIDETFDDIKVLAPGAVADPVTTPTPS